LCYLRQTLRQARHSLPYKHRALVPILDLFERAYFRRVWIRQELALANYATVYCGHQQLSYRTFRDAVACVLIKGFYYSAIPPERMSAWDSTRTMIFRIVTLGLRSCSYASLGQYLGNAECRDPRDRIYAMLSLMRKPDSLIGIEPDYSQTTEQLYTNAATRAMETERNLSLLESCNLATRTLDIPSWVPDWSVPWEESNINSGWSACGWISAKLSVLDAKRIRVSGVAVTRVVAVLPADVGYIKDEQERCNAVVGVLRDVESRSRDLEARTLPERYWVDTFRLVATNSQHAESYEPHRKQYPTFHEFFEAIEAIAFLPDRCKDETIPFKNVLLTLQQAWLGLEFFLTTDGYIGLANPGVREGDLVSVLFGSTCPIILRLQDQDISKEPESWQVVGTARVSHLMEGEILYGRTGMSRLQGVHCVTESVTASDLIDGHAVAMKDYDTGEMTTDPAEFLTRRGIKVDSYQRRPHRLDVSLDTLRAAGVKVQDFILV
jgi:hypothetical protein